MEVLHESAHIAISVKWTLAGQHFIEHNTEGIDIAGLGGFAQNLLRGHIIGCTCDRGSALVGKIDCQWRILICGKDLDQPKVREKQAFLSAVPAFRFKEQIARLDITMNQTEIMSIL